MAWLEIRGSTLLLPPQFARLLAKGPAEHGEDKTFLLPQRHKKAENTGVLCVRRGDKSPASSLCLGLESCFTCGKAQQSNPKGSLAWPDLCARLPEDQGHVMLAGKYLGDSSSGPVAIGQGVLVSNWQSAYLDWM